MPDERRRKAEIRERVWAALDVAGVSPGCASGRIPDFTGSAAAADRVRNLPAWQRARTV